jgi:hypothetical protein
MFNEKQIEGKKSQWELSKGRSEETLYTITVTVECSVAFLKWT